MEFFDGLIWLVISEVIGGVKVMFEELLVDLFFNCFFWYYVRKIIDGFIKRNGVDCRNVLYFKVLSGFWCMVGFGFD